MSLSDQEKPPSEAHSSSPSRWRICLAVPTVVEREGSMLACIKMVSRLTRDANTDLSLVLVQNGVERPTLQVEDLSAALGDDVQDALPLSIIAEPQRGIPFARNTALRFARDGGYDFVAFIDDDAEPDPNWLVESLKVLRDRDAVSGPQIPRFPDGVARNLREAAVYRERRLQNEKPISWAATNNVLFSVDFVTRHDLWFDENMRTGGSDKEFFLRFTNCGGQMFWAAHARVYEDVEPNRLSLAWIWRREWRKGATEFYIMRSTQGAPKAVAMCFVKGGYYGVSAIKNLLRFATGKAEGWTDAIADTAHGISVVLGIWGQFRPKSYS